MKFLFTPVGSQVTVYAVAPLATAVRNAGHEVLLAVNEPLLEFAEATQLPAVSIMPEPTRHFVMNGPAKEPAPPTTQISRMSTDAKTGLRTQILASHCM